MQKSSHIVRDNSNILGKHVTKDINNDKCWGGGEINNRGNNSISSANCNIQQKNTNYNNTNPFRQFATHSSRQRQAPNIEDLIRSLSLPCCNTNPYQQNCTILNPLSSTIYTMPCSHGICQHCVETIIYQNNNGDDLPIECSQCGEQYSNEEAGTMFIKNLMAMEMFEKLLAIKIKMDEEVGLLYNETNEKIKGTTANKKQLVSSKSTSALPVHKVHFSRDPEEALYSLQQQQQLQTTLTHRNQQQTVKKSNRSASSNLSNTSPFLLQTTTPQIKQTTSSSQNSQQIPQFNPCANIFCRNPAIGFYCSQECQQLIVDLESIKYEIGNVITIVQQTIC